MYKDSSGATQGDGGRGEGHERERRPHSIEVLEMIKQRGVLRRAYDELRRLVDAALCDRERWRRQSTRSSMA